MESAPGHQPWPKKKRTSYLILVAEIPCTTPEEAKAVAECETLGEAVTVRRIEQSDGTKGWEVLVHMPGRNYGWRCTIDLALGKLRTKEAIPNPPSKVRCHPCFIISARPLAAAHGRSAWPGPPPGSPGHPPGHPGFPGCAPGGSPLPAAPPTATGGSPRSCPADP